MKVWTTSFNEVNIQMTADEAAALASVLALVSDRQSTAPMDRLYNHLMSNGVADAGTAYIEENPGYDPEMNDDKYLVVSL